MKQQKLFYFRISDFFVLFSVSVSVFFRFKFLFYSPMEYQNVIPIITETETKTEIQNNGQFLFQLYS